MLAGSESHGYKPSLSFPPFAKICAVVGLRPVHLSNSPILKASTNPSRPSQKSKRSKTSCTSATHKRANTEYWYTTSRHNTTRLWRHRRRTPHACDRPTDRQTYTQTGTKNWTLTSGLNVEFCCCLYYGRYIHAYFYYTTVVDMRTHPASLQLGTLYTFLLQTVTCSTHVTYSRATIVLRSHPRGCFTDVYST